MRKKLEITRLIFVYKANSGVLSAVADSAKKMLMIKGCALCSITHSLTGEKREWKECKAEIGVPVDYVHKNELEGPVREITGDRLPCVLAVAGGRYHLLLKPEILERCKGSVSDLKGRLVYHAAANDLVFPQELKAALVGRS